jgi:hypothetical protein
MSDGLALPPSERAAEIYSALREAGLQIIDENYLAEDAVRRFHGSELWPARLALTQARKTAFLRLAEIVKSEVAVDGDLSSIPSEARPEICELATLVVSLDRLFTSGQLLEETARDLVSGHEHALCPIDGEENRSTEYVCLEGEDRDAVTISGQPDHVEEVLTALGLRREGKELVRIEKPGAPEEKLPASVLSTVLAGPAGVPHHRVLKWIEQEGAPFLEGKFDPQSGKVFEVDLDAFIDWLYDRKGEYRQLVGSFQAKARQAEQDARQYADPLNGIERRFARGKYRPRKSAEVA